MMRKTSAKALQVNSKPSWLRLLLTLSFFCSTAVWGSDFGTTGIVTVPSARQMNDGALASTVSSNQVVNIFNITYQVTPWLESTFRYSVFNPYDRIESRDGLRDRSYEVKARILAERNWRPALALGVRDVLGTGVWNGEYVVASKAVENLDITLGFGWGRFASRSPVDNPLGWIDPRFDERPAGSVGGDFGGEVRAKSFFRGPIGFFGGIRYRLQKVPISLLMEYSGDDYGREVRFGSLNAKQPVNFGLEWSPTDSLSIAASYQQGEFFGLSFRASGDFKHSAPKRQIRMNSVLSSEGVKEAPTFLNLDDWYDRMLFDVERMGLRMHTAYGRVGDRERSFVLSNESFAETGDAINQFLRAAELHLPKDVDLINVHLLEDGFDGPVVRYVRANSKSHVRFMTGRQRADSLVQIRAPSELDRPLYATDFGYPRLVLGADLALRIQLMDPNEPLKHQLYMKGTARFALNETTNIRSSYSLNISNDFNTRRASDSVLTRVRSELNEYLTQGETGIDSLFLEHRESLSNEMHLRSYAGLIEEMFGGVGAELLFEPFGERWALGANFNWVKQRGFPKDFSFKDYQVLTGHVSAFWASPFYNLDFGLHAGKYLAGDVGYTLEARRTFNNGFSIGAFFTRTDVSAADFGEGSFDKGLFLRIPLHLILPLNTRGGYSTVIRSIERDGGRRLEGGIGNLWWDRRAVRFDALSEQKEKMLP